LIGALTAFGDEALAAMAADLGKSLPSEPDVITVTLLPLPDERPVEARLRLLLKTALRRDRLRCVRASAASPEEVPPVAYSEPEGIEAAGGSPRPSRRF
jgi:hypothetical protein